MQRERFSDSPEYLLRLEEYKKTLGIISDIRSEMNNTINGLRGEREHHMNAAGRIEYLFFSTMIARLDHLSGSILSMAEGGWTKDPINLDDSNFSQEMEGMIRHYSFFRGLSSNDIKSTIKDAEVMGTDCMLDALTPETVDNKDNYFFPFRKDLSEMLGYVTTKRINGWEELAFATRVPNIEAVYSYPPGERTIPTRFIRPKVR